MQGKTATKRLLGGDAPGLKPEHYEIFDTAMGQRAISPMGHVRMMAAVQPFLSGAISKTVNLPEDATVEEIADVYYQGWKLGLKALAVYRDNCKVGQPLSDGGGKAKKDAADVVEAAVKVADEMCNNSPDSLIVGRKGIRLSWESGNAEEAVSTLAEQWYPRLVEGANFAEGIRAFAEKRSPKWVNSKL